MPKLLTNKPLEECTYEELIGDKERLIALLNQVEGEIERREQEDEEDL
ncbi:MAG: hypothetical protein WC102_03270 [Saccharofermentanales bacterium]